MKNVLVVDDFQTNGLLVRQALPSSKYNVKVVTSGRQALESLKNRQEDIILLDIMMPEMDGIETLKRIKSNPETKDIPVIFLTGQADRSRIMDGFKYGVADIIAKPIVPGVAIERIDNVLSGNGPRDRGEIRRAELEALGIIGPKDSKKNPAKEGAKQSSKQAAKKQAKEFSAENIKGINEKDKEETMSLLADIDFLVSAPDKKKEEPEEKEETKDLISEAMPATHVIPLMPDIPDFGE